MTANMIYTWAMDFSWILSGRFLGLGILPVFISKYSQVSTFGLGVCGHNYMI